MYCWGFVEGGGGCPKAIYTLSFQFYCLLPLTIRDATTTGEQFNTNILRTDSMQPVYLMVVMGVGVAYMYIII